MFLPLLLNLSSQLVLSFLHSGQVFQYHFNPITAGRPNPHKDWQQHPSPSCPSSCLHPVQSQFCLCTFSSSTKSSGPERSTMNSKLTPPQNTTSDGINIFLCSTGHKTFLKMLQEKTKSQKSIPQWKRTAENKGIISALGP